MQIDSKVELKIKDQNFFECHICHNAYEDPRILPCGHTFCFVCMCSGKPPVMCIVP